MTYEQFQNQAHFNLQELLAFAHFHLIDDPPGGFEARLPTPPFLMIDRIVSLSGNGSRGQLVAEQEIRLDAWYFQCHFAGDPVQPGCLCLDAVWQLLGFFCVWQGALGAGRALGSGEVAFYGQVRPHNAVVRYELTVHRLQRLKRAGTTLALADAEIFVDGESITRVKGARVGVFQGIAYSDYPNASDHAVGGRMGG